KFLKLAIKEAEAKNYEAKGNYINKAIDIINELNAVLDMDAGGEIAGNLRKLYFFMNDRLSQANVKNDPQMISEVITLLEELNQSWKAIAE
ncbi:MAG: flagellar export chaperone FliS, partial [Planctomycetota bacterium]